MNNRLTEIREMHERLMKVTKKCLHGNYIDGDQLMEDYESGICSVELISKILTKQYLTSLHEIYCAVDHHTVPPVNVDNIVIKRI